MAVNVGDLQATLGLETLKFRQGARDATGALKTMTASFDDFGDRLKSVGATLTKTLTVALVGMAAAATAAGLTFDKALDKIRIGTGATGRDLQRLERDFREVFRGVPTSSEQVSTAIADLNTRLNLTGEPLRELSTQFLNLARITGQDVTPLIREGTRTFNLWGVATANQSGLLNTFFKISQATGIGVSELFGQVNRAGPAFAALGFSVEETAAMFGLFEKGGIEGQRIVSGLQQGMEKLTKGGTIPARQGFDELILAIKSADSAETALMATQGILESRTALPFVDAVRKGAFEYRDFTAAIGSSEETIGRAASATDGFIEMMILLKNRVADALEPLGTELLRVMEQQVIPAIGLGVDVLASMIRVFMALPEPVRFAAIGLAGLAAVIGPLALGVGAVLPILGSMAATALPALAIAIKGVSVALAFLAANPLVLVAAGLVALIPILDAVGKRFAAEQEKVRAYGDELARLDLIRPGVAKIIQGLEAQLDKTFVPKRRAEIQAMIDSLRSISLESAAFPTGPIKLGALAIEAFGKSTSKSLGAASEVTQEQSKALAALTEELNDLFRTDAEKFLDKVAKAFADAPPHVRAQAMAIAQLTATTLSQITVTKEETAALISMHAGEEKAWEGFEELSAQMRNANNTMGPLIAKEREQTAALVAMHAGEEKAWEGFAELSAQMQNANKTVAPLIIAHQQQTAALKSVRDATERLGIDTAIARAELAGKMTPATQAQIAALSQFKMAYEQLNPEQAKAIDLFVESQQQLALYRSALDFVKAGYSEQTAIALSSLQQQAIASDGFFDGFTAGALDFLARGKSMFETTRDFAKSAFGDMTRFVSDFLFDFTTGVLDAEKLFEDFGRSLLRTLTNVLADKAVTALVDVGFDLAKSLVGPITKFAGPAVGLIADLLRFHEGGVVGVDRGLALQPDEFGAVLARGEAVLPADVTRGLDAMTRGAGGPFVDRIRAFVGDAGGTGAGGGISTFAGGPVAGLGVAGVPSFAGFAATPTTLGGMLAQGLGIQGLNLGLLGLGQVSPTAQVNAALTLAGFAVPGLGMLGAITAVVATALTALTAGLTALGVSAAPTPTVGFAAMGFTSQAALDTIAEGLGLTGGQLDAISTAAAIGQTVSEGIAVAFGENAEGMGPISAADAAAAAAAVGAIGNIGEGLGEGLSDFQHGGVVSGPIGEPQLVVAHGGEEFLGVGGSRGGSGTLVVKVMVGEREIGEAVVRDFNRRALGGERFIPDEARFVRGRS